MDREFTGTGLAVEYDAELDCFCNIAQNGYFRDKARAGHFIEGIDGPYRPTVSHDDEEPSRYSLAHGQHGRTYDGP